MNEILINKMQELIKMDKIVEAIDLLKINKDKFSEFEYEILLGDLYCDSDDFENGILCYEKLIKDYLGYNKYAILLRYSSCLRKMARYGESLSYLDILINDYPHDSVLYFNKGNVYLSMNNYDGAIKEYMNGYNIDPEDADMLNNLGLAFMRKGDRLNALKYLSEGLFMHNDDKQIIENIAILLEDMGEYEESERYFKMIRELNSERF